MKQHQETTKSGNKSFAYGNAAEMMVDPNYDFYDVIEPIMDEEDAYKEAARFMTLQLRTVFDYVFERVDHTDPKTTVMLLASMAYALGIDDIMNNKSQRQIARDLGLSHGIISYHCKKIKEQLRDNISKQ